MKNFLGMGDTVAVTVAAGSDAVDLSSGDGYVIGSLFGVAAHDAAIGETVQLKTTGVFRLAKTTAQAWTVGQRIYWDAATAKATSTASSNKLIGVAVAVAASNDTTGDVRLTAAFTV